MHKYRHGEIKLKDLNGELFWTSHVDVNGSNIIFTVHPHRRHTSQKPRCKKMTGYIYDSSVVRTIMLINGKYNLTSPPQSNLGRVCRS